MFLSAKNSVIIYSKAIEYMEKNIYHNILNQDIARFCCVSVSGLQKNFKEIAHCSVKAFYRRMKLEEAMRLLKQGEKVGEIAKKLNYSSIPHLSMAFKKQYGVSPLKYKSSSMEQ